MLEINQNVYDQFANIETSRFLDDLKQLLFEQFPAFNEEPTDRFELALRKIFEDSKRFGLKSERSIAVYATTAGYLGLDYPSQFEGAMEILDSETPEQEKADLLEAFTMNLLEILAE